MGAGRVLLCESTERTVLYVFMCSLIGSMISVSVAVVVEVAVDDRKCQSSRQPSTFESHS